MVVLSMSLLFGNAVYAQITTENGIHVSGGSSSAQKVSSNIGHSTMATGYNSFASGYASEATGHTSTALGGEAKATGNIPWHWEIMLRHQPRIHLYLVRGSPPLSLWSIPPGES